jgi:hypothetical protein
LDAIRGNIVKGLQHSPPMIAYVLSNNVGHTILQQRGENHKPGKAQSGLKKPFL